MRHGLTTIAFTLGISFAYGQDPQQQQDQGLSQGPATTQQTSQQAGPTQQQTGQAQAGAQETGHPSPLRPPEHGHPGPLKPPEPTTKPGPGPLLPPDKDSYNFKTLTLQVQGFEGAVVHQTLTVSADGKYSIATQRPLKEVTLQQGQLSSQELESLKHIYGPLGESESVPSKMPGRAPFPGASTFEIDVNGALRTSGTFGAEKDLQLDATQRKEWALVTPVLSKLSAILNAAPAPKQETVVGTLQVHTEGTGLGDPPHLVYTVSIDPPKAGQSNQLTVRVTADGQELLRDLAGAVGKPVQLSGQVSGDTISISKSDDFKTVAAAPRSLTPAAPSATPGLVGGVQKADSQQQQAAAPAQQQAAAAPAQAAAAPAQAAPAQQQTPPAQQQQQAAPPAQQQASKN